MIGAGINKFLVDVADLVESKKLTDVVDISNQSNKDGIRIVLELRKDADIDRIKNILYKKTKLEDTFGVNMLAIADGRPETLNLKGILRNFMEFQYQNTERKYNVLLEKELDKKEIQEGLIAACDCIDLIIAILRGSKNLKDAKACLVNGDISNIHFKVAGFEEDAKKLHFTERQASAILEMRLYKLIGLEILNLQKEYDECVKKIEKYEKILGNRKEMAKVIKSDLLNIKKEYGVARRTVIEDGEAAVFEEKKIPEMEVMFIMDRFGYARTIDMAAFERNKDAVFNENKYVIPVMNTDKICIFTDTGDLHQLKIKDLPFTKFRDKGTPIDNLCNYDSSKEIIVYITPFERLKNQKMLFVTRQGMMKLVDSEEFQVAKRTVACTKLADDDKLIGMYSTDARVEIYSKFSLDGEIKEEEVVESNQNVIVQTENGVFLKFPLTDIPMKKKSAVGVRGIKLSKDDYIEDVFLLTEGDEFTMEYKGKSISFAKMKTAHRDTKGTKIRV